jgi:hypothetical protein
MFLPLVATRLVIGADVVAVDCGPYGQLRRPDNYFWETVGIQWRGELEGRRHSPWTNNDWEEEAATWALVPSVRLQTPVGCCGGGVECWVLVIVVAGSCCRWWR